MRIHIGTDHAGFELKGVLVSHWREAGHEVIDHGCYAYDRLDDYPEFCIACAEAVAAEPGSLGVVLGGSGNGEQMAANLVSGVRAALVWSEETARLARCHNDANVAGLGARMHTIEEAVGILDAFITEPFSGDQRHQNRIDQMAAYEAGRTQRRD
ncbi:ribose-5-phosphate isomerase [Actinomyces procaprae]|uniref:ribose-5-phosphate isomerase n=1 Tax=Actinomyces procaprae TaxID=2560010 RepID=UPI00109DAFCC|nr:ribose-5-phosphate isomerase [Actinomyces procaprae]